MSTYVTLPLLKLAKYLLYIVHLYYLLVEITKVKLTLILRDLVVTIQLKLVNGFSTAWSTIAVHTATNTIL